MLGHDNIQVDKSKILNIISKTISKEQEILEILLMVLAKDGLILDLFACFGDKTMEFLNLFSGCTIKISEKSIKYSHLPEIKKYFGDETAEKFKLLFSGYNVKIPQSSYISTLIRDIDIYCRIRDTTDRKSTVKLICSHYRMKVYEVSWVYRKMCKLLLDNEM